MVVIIVSSLRRAASDARFSIIVDSRFRSATLPAPSRTAVRKAAKIAR
jgi:hypothetical protein